jgi:hypothetical protein
MERPGEEKGKVRYSSGIESRRIRLIPLQITAEVAYLF